MKRFLMNSLRFIISFGLLGFLVYNADLDKIIQVLRNTDSGYFGLALLAFLAALFLFALRWKILLNYIDVRLGFMQLTGFYFIGYFFNNFLPTMIGGDVSRIFFAAKETGKRTEMIGTVLLERILGILATLTLASVSLIWALPYFDSSAEVLIITFFLFAMVGFILLNLLNVRLFQFTSKILDKITLMGIGAKINAVFSQIHLYRQARVTILLAFGLSVGCQLLLILMNLLLAYSLNLETVTFSYLTFVVPVTFIMGLIPSINGLGIRDLGYQGLLNDIGVTSAQALSLSFLNTIVPMLMSIIGGILLLFQRNRSGVTALNGLTEHPES